MKKFFALVAFLMLMGGPASAAHDGRTWTFHYRKGAELEIHGPDGWHATHFKDGGVVEMRNRGGRVVARFYGVHTVEMDP